MELARLLDGLLDRVVVQYRVRDMSRQLPLIELLHVVIKGSSFVP